jgi:hypothetical protein
MNKLFKPLHFLAVIALFITACGTQVVQAEPVQSESVPTNGYQAVLGKSLNDTDVVDFITRNNCTSSGPFWLCRSAGLALWSDRDQMIKTAYLYISNAEGFTDYEGELPFGLTSNDTMADVEQKYGCLVMDTY